MRKRMIIIMIAFAFLFVTKVYAQTADTDIYCIQLGAYSTAMNADLSVKRMQQKGIEAFRISTSIHSVFYGVYSDKREASAALSNIKKIVAGAFVTKLSKKQAEAYLKSNRAMDAASNGLEVADTTGTSGKIMDETGYSKTEKEKQVVIKKVDSNSLEYTYKVINDIELRGIKGESKWFFEVDEELAVKDFKLNLFCRVNELIKRDRSYVTIYMNNIPVKSMNFKGDNNQLLYSWAIDVPANLINKGYNELKIMTHSRISDMPCEDDKNIANWVILDGKTNYVIDYDKKYMTEKVANFPQSFIGLHADDAKGIGVVIPDAYTNHEISAALTLIAYLEELWV